MSIESESAERPVEEHAESAAVQAPTDAPTGPAARPTAAARSEVTRLMCAGAYLNGAFRRAAIRELVDRRERATAPSLGFDLEPVLRHCLHARRMEAEAAVWLGLAWLLPLPGTVLFALVGGLLLDGSEAERFQSSLVTGVAGGLLAFAYCCVISWAARAVSGRATAVYLEDQQRHTGRGGPRGAVGGFLRFQAWLSGAALAVTTVGGLIGAVGAGGIAAAIVLIAVITLIARTIDWHRSRVDRVLATELGREVFSGTGPDVPSDYAPALRDLAREQFAPVVVYDPARPFMGAGVPRKAWSIAVELRTRTKGGGAPGEAGPDDPELSGRLLVDLIKQRIGALAEPSTDTALDRLTGLEITECVFLPGPLPFGYRRDQLPIDGNAATAHVGAAVGEGAEQRRHFLRVRVGGWEEQVVTTVFVRAHCQGGILVLEVVPHVLAPLGPGFRSVENVRPRAGGLFGRMFSALAAAPSVTFSVIASYARSASSARIARSRWAVARVEPPWIGLREQAMAYRLSLFQEMDVDRYIRTLQDRITSAVGKSLVDAGYKDDEFKQQVVTVAAGGVYIGGSMSGGAVASGSGSQAAHTVPTGSGGAADD